MTRMPARRLPVAVVAAAILVTVTSLVLGAFGAANFLNERRREFGRLHREVASQADELAMGLALPAWNIDRAQIDKIVDGQSARQAISGVVVRAAGTTHARVRGPGGGFVPSAEGPPGRGLIVEERPITFSGERVGTVKLFATTALIERELRDSLTTIVMTILAIDLLLIVSVYLVLWQAVLRPLVGIEQYAVAVSKRGEEPIPVLAPERTAELESLRQSIETMVRLLDRRYAELQEEMALRFESEERFGTIFESANDAILIQDADTGAVLDVNPRMTEMFGYSREQSLALDIAAISSGAGPYTEEQGLALIRAAVGRSPEPFEWQVRHADGHFFWVEVSLRVISDRGRQVAIVVVRDVERRKEMEAALRRSETMAAMGALVAGVAHEVRNPLFGMSALLDAYAEELSHPDLAELAPGLREQVVRLTSLTTELLDFGRPVKITQHPGLLGELIDEVIASRARKATAAGVTLRSTIDRAPLWIQMDRSRLRQVFENLVDNALQHVSAGGSVTIAASAVVLGEWRGIECTVADDGPGFDPADLTRVFEPFFTHRAGGVGLGLSIVQRIVEEHAGQVRAGNRSEGGAMVTVRLPG
jgi:PAS domain S-box-containing protein